MASPIPFLVFAGLSQQNIYNQRKHSRQRSKNREEKITLPDTKDEIIESSTNRYKSVSFFDLLVIRQIHSDSKAQQAILNLSENYNDIIKKAREEVDGKIEQIALKTEQLYKKIEDQVENLRSLGFNIRYPRGDYNDIDEAYKAEGIIPELYSYRGYDNECFIFPKYINGINLTSENFSLTNPYEKPLQDFLSKYPNNKNDLKSAKEDLETLKSKKLSLVFSKKKRNELKQAQTAYNKYQSIANTIASLQNNVDFYEKLTLEQKATISELLQNINSIKNLSKESQKYVLKQQLIYKRERINCSSEQINAYHTAVIKQASKKLSKQELINIAELEEHASNKIHSLTDEQAIEIIKSSVGTLHGFEIDGKIVDSSILFEISDNCYEKINKLNALKEISENEEDHIDIEMQ